MINILRVALGLIVLILAIYGLITNNVTMLPYMMFFLGLMSLVIGFSELQKKRKLSGIISIIASVLVFSYLIDIIIR